MSNPPPPLDCLVVGGGPAGLTAAIYLARFRRRVAVVDNDQGRLAMIPLSHNHPGFPEGIVGCDLLARMRAQAAQFGARLIAGEVDGLAGRQDDFTAKTADGQRFAARTILLATGVVNRRPPLPEAVHADAVARGLIRYCPICDGFEQQGRRVGILGADAHGMAEALFMRSFTDRLTLLTLTHPQLSASERQRLRDASVHIVDTPISAMAFPPGEGDGLVRVTLADGGTLSLDTLYCALGSETRNALAVPLGVKLAEGQCFLTDAHQRCNVPGLYAAGDAVEGLDQISVATGTGARAAVAIHNDLRDRDGEGSAA